MLSVPHLIVIFLVALIVFGPEKLPELARTLSKAMFEFNRATGGLKQTLQDEMRQLEREVTEQRGSKVPAPATAEPAVSPETSWPPEPEVEQPHGGPLPGATAESSSPQPGGEEEQAPDPTPGSPTDGHPSAA